MNNKTAILIFANSAKAEGLNKPFQHSTVLFNALNTQIETKVRRSNLPYFIVSETEQIGQSFGERFTNAIKSIFDKGFENIITVGNDTPHLKTSHIKQAHAKLNDNALVLGPSKDGGFYLMAISKSLFNADRFVALPWRTSILNQRILKVLALKKVDIALLEVLTDIDCALDAKTITDSFKSISALVKSILIQIITSAKAIIIYVFQFIKLSFISITYNKGSPIYFQ